jgi:hypothetical protein
LSFELQDVVFQCQQLQVQFLILGEAFDKSNPALSEFKTQADEFYNKAQLIEALAPVEP